MKSNESKQCGLNVTVGRQENMAIAVQCTVEEELARLQQWFPLS